VKRHRFDPEGLQPAERAALKHQVAVLLEKIAANSQPL